MNIFAEYRRIMYAECAYIGVIVLLTAVIDYVR